MPDAAGIYESASKARPVRKPFCRWFAPRAALAACLCLAAAPSHGADTRRREEQKRLELLAKAHKELELLRRRLEDAKVRRWQDKRNDVAAQEAFQKMWDDLKRDIDQLNQAKIRKEEMLLRLRGQRAEREETVGGQEERYRQFRYLLLEKVDETVEKLEGDFPHRLPERQAAWSETQQALAGEGSLNEPLERIFRLHAERYHIGETGEILRESLPIRGQAALAAENPGVDIPESVQGKLVAGLTLRLGTFYKAFVSTESQDAAILVKTGRLGPRAWKWLEEIPQETRLALQTAGARLAAGGTDGPMLLPMDVQLRNASGEGFQAEARMGLWAYAKDEFSKGGFSMYLIVGALLLGLLLTLERAAILAYQSLGRKEVRAVLAHLESGALSRAQDAARKLRGALGEVLRSVVDSARLPREDAESRVHAAMLKHTSGLERNLGTINVLAAAAPLLGLLGTVSGMINLFTAITVHGTENPRYMADGIAEALITTKWGLLVAVPLLLLYSFLSDWAGRIIASMECTATESVNILHGAKEEPDPVPAGMAGAEGRKEKG